MKIARKLLPVILVFPAKMDNNHQEKETECITPPRLSPAIVGGLVLAFILGMLANKLRISPLVGYLLAGVLAGPFTPGFVADTKFAPELAELGVILLMFGVGLHFSLKDLMAVKSIAIPGAIAQIAVATLLGMALSAVLGWSLMTWYRVRLMSFHRQYRGVTARNLKNGN